MAAAPTYATLNHIKFDILHDTEKPYRLQYDPGEGIPRTNYSLVAERDVPIYDLRDEDHRSITFAQDGISMIRLLSHLQPDDFYDDNKVREIYYEEVKRLLRRSYGAKRVEILEHSVILDSFDSFSPSSTELTGW